MKLKKIYIKNYKNLKNFSMNIEKGNGLSILIGNNGSGKSNILEVISGIFAEAFRGLSELIGTDYNLEYTIDHKNITLKKDEGKCFFYCDGNQISAGEIIKYLPSKVIALYSGEDTRLWEQFYLPTYIQYFKDIFSGQPGNMGMNYVNKYFWNISLFTMLLFSEDLSDIKDFLKDELEIKTDSDIESILIKFDFKEYSKNQNQLVKAFIEKINPDHSVSVAKSLDAWKAVISNDVDYFNANSNDVFDKLLQAFMPKDYKVITEIQIKMKNKLTLESLSEGEKKLILIRSVLEFVADENALLLFDEPDANIHEERKRKLYNMLRTIPNRDIIITTHSPIIAKIASKDELIYLEAQEESIAIIEKEKLNLVQKLASDEWNIIDAGIFLNSKRPLVLFEGKSDISYVRRAIKLLKEDNLEYAKIDVDFLCFNGTGNADSFIKNVWDCVPNKEIIVFFDRDDAGKTSMATLRNIDKKSDEIQDYNDYISDDKPLKAVFYPYSAEVNSGEFWVEDYFPESRIEEIINELVEKKKHPVKNLANLSKRVKDALSTKFINYKKNDFNNFKPLIDKLIKLIKK